MRSAALTKFRAVAVKLVLKFSMFCMAVADTRIEPKALTSGRITVRIRSQTPSVIPAVGHSVTGSARLLSEPQQWAFRKAKALAGSSTPCRCCAAGFRISLTSSTAARMLAHDWPSASDSLNWIEAVKPSEVSRQPTTL